MKGSPVSVSDGAEEEPSPVDSQERKSSLCVHILSRSLLERLSL